MRLLTIYKVSYKALKLKQIAINLNNIYKKIEQRILSTIVLFIKYPSNLSSLYNYYNR
jgi:hypothetical protein